MWSEDVQAVSSNLLVGMQSGSRSIITVIQSCNVPDRKRCCASIVEVRDSLLVLVRHISALETNRYRLMPNNLRRHRRWSKTSSLRPSTLLIAQHSQPYSKIGSTHMLYNCSLTWIELQPQINYHQDSHAILFTWSPYFKLSCIALRALTICAFVAAMLSRASSPVSSRPTRNWIVSVFKACTKQQQQPFTRVHFSSLMNLTYVHFSNVRRTPENNSYEVLKSSTENRSAWERKCQKPAVQRTIEE